MATRHLTVSNLAQLLGEKQALRLLKHFAGCRLPSPKSWLVDQRRQAIVADYRRGYPLSDIAAKYKMDMGYVKGVITTALRLRRQRIIDQGEDPWVSNLTD